MSIHPFEELPFDIQKLDIDIQKSIEEFDYYSTSNEIEWIIVEKELTDSNSLLCLAYYNWLDAMDNDGDIVSFGGRALKIIDTIIEKEPKHKSALKLKKYIEKRIDKVKKATKKLDKFYKIPVENLSLEQAQDFASALSNFKTDKISKELECKLWIRLYNETPEYEDFDNYGLKFYYLCRITHVLWTDLKQIEAAREYINTVINWKALRDIERYTVQYYRNVGYLIVEAIENNNAEEFINYIEILKQKCIKLTNTKIYDWQYYAPLFSEETTCKILHYALKLQDKDLVRYILEEMIVKQEYVIPKQNEFKEVIKEAKRFLN